MKAHKFWSCAAFGSMALAAVTGCCGNSKELHKIAGAVSIGCMGMAVYSGHRMIAGRKKADEELDATFPEEPFAEEDEL